MAGAGGVLHRPQAAGLSMSLGLHQVQNDAAQVLWVCLNLKKRVQHPCTAIRLPISQTIFEIGI